MLITPAALTAINRTLTTTYKRALEGTQPWYQQLTTEVPSTSSQNDYAWLADIPAMREWLGERVVNNLHAYNYSIANKTFELTIGVRKEHIEDDNLGIYDMRATLMGEAVKKHPDDLLTTLITNGTTTNCYDGQYFFDTDHPIVTSAGAAGTASNYTSTGFALTQANAMTARATMFAYTGDNGKPIATNPRLLVVPPQLESAARIIAAADVVASGNAGVSNISKGLFDVLVIPELAAAPTAWYLLDVSKTVKPFIFQRRTQPSFQSQVSLTDDTVFWRREFIWGVDYRANAGYGLWQLAYKGVA
jgi:phage major head subunit gpT-like protein